jgi:hypothetical protein
MNIAFDLTCVGASAWDWLPLSLDTAIIAFDHPLRIYKAISFGGTAGLGYCISNWFHIPNSMYYNLPHNLDGYRFRLAISDAVWIRGYADTTVSFYEKDGYGSFSPSDSFTKSVRCAGNLFGSFDMDFTLHKLSHYEVNQYAGKFGQAEGVVESALMQADQELLKKWGKKLGK